MTPEIALVLAIAATAMVLFMTEKLRMDIVAMLVLVSLAVTGLVTPSQALGGFSNQATITVAAMFVLAAGIENTGALSGLSTLLGRTGSPVLFLLTLFGLLALIAPFVNNTAVVAVFMPIVIAASLRIGMPPTKALIPLSYVSQMIGVCTLIGTSTNLIVNSLAQDFGHPGFTMFQFLPLGAACALAGCIYLLTLGRWLLPSEGNTDLDALHESGYYVTEFRILAESKLVDRSVEDAALSGDFQVYVLELWRDGRKLWSPRSEVLQEGDVLLVRGKWPNLERMKEERALEYNTEAAGPPGAEGARDDKRIMAEAMVSPNSIVAGHRLEALNRRFSHHTSILGVQRRGQVIRDQLDETILRVGDILLLILPESHLGALRRSRDFIVLSERVAPQRKGWRAPFSWSSWPWWSHSRRPDWCRSPSPRWAG